MAVYEYRCRECDVAFEVRRPIGGDETIRPRCPAGHDDVARVWSAVALAGKTAPAASTCCGGGCCN